MKRLNLAKTMSGVKKYQSINVEHLLGRQLSNVESNADPGELFLSGSLDIPLPSPKVSIIGSRKASPQGIANARRIAKTLIEDQVTIVSGLAEGIDTTAHVTALDMNGKTVAVIGTPLDQVFPKANYDLQQKLMKSHLVVSQFPTGYPITGKNFVMRNKTMALISDAAVIVEAGETSGSRHHGWETLRMKKSLFIWESVVNDKKLSWPTKMIEYGAVKLSDPSDMIKGYQHALK